MSWRQAVIIVLVSLVVAIIALVISLLVVQARGVGLHG